MKDQVVLGYEGVVLHKFFDRLFPADRVYAAGLTRKFSKLAKEEGYEVNLVQSHSKSGYINNYITIHPTHLKKLLDSYNFKPSKVLDLQGYDNLDHFTKSLEDMVAYEFKLLNDSIVPLIQMDKEYEGDPMSPKEEHKIFRTMVFLVLILGLLIFNACKVFGASQMVVEEYMYNKNSLYSAVIQHIQILENKGKSTKITKRLSDVRARATNLRSIPSRKEALALPDKEIIRLNNRIIQQIPAEYNAIQNTVRGNY